MHPALVSFHPLIGRWFLDEIGTPTDVQARAWPEIAAGRHVLLTAPTGSGKTLAAFLHALDRLISGAWKNGRTRVLYVSPLKALNNDVRRNLLEPLDTLRARFSAAGEPFPEIQVLTRSGDTAPEERRRMLRRPPEILITTPESLNLLLSSRNGQSMLRELETVILDEIHAVAGNKRGVHLMTAVDRLVLLSGEFQRVALSATVRPLEAVAAFVGGYECDGRGEDVRYRKRAVRLVGSDTRKALDVRIRRTDFEDADAFWAALAGRIRTLMADRSSTLVFVNSRRACERLAFMLNDGERTPVAYAHHGSLSRELRAVVEERMKRGELKAIVATNSLELGIDIGALDQVILVQTPPGVASALQRIGRAGHQVGAVSQGLLFPTHGRDYIEAAVMAQAVRDLDIEPVSPISCALDVLAQVLISMTGVQPWRVDDLFDWVRTCAPYHDLTRRQFDLVLDMIAGRYADSRIRELRPLVQIDRIDGTVQGSQGGLYLVYRAGGTIADRGYYTLRRTDSNARIGELDEEFVWERTPGDRFPLGTQTWKIDRITHNDVYVSPAPTAGMVAPFWRAEERNRSHHFSARLGAFLEEIDGRVRAPDLAEQLARDCGMDPDAAEVAVDFLRRQREATGAPLPHRHHLLVEYLPQNTGVIEQAQTILHTMWGGAVNRPFAMALAQAWEDRFHHALEIYANDDSVALLAPDPVTADEILALVTPEAVDGLLRRKLEQTGYFGAQFRECAGIALQLPKPSFGKRLPLWLNRIRAKKLLDAVMRYEDFPILAETWRSCLCDDFDVPALKELLEELRRGVIRSTTCVSHAPSPFAAAMTWRQTNTYMYMDDTPQGGRVSRLDSGLLREVVQAGLVRPRIPRAVAARFQAKAQRVFPGYAPGDGEELLAWLRERLLVPEAEWRALLDAVAQDHGAAEADLLAPVAAKITVLHFPDLDGAHVAALETLPRLARVFGLDTDSLAPIPPAGDTLAIPKHLSREEGATTLPEWLGEWLRFYGPIARAELARLLPVAEDGLDGALSALLDEQAVVMDQLIEGSAELEVCDAENYEILLRLARDAARPDFAPLPAEQLPLALAAHQGLAAPAGDAAGLTDAIEPLIGRATPAALLETEILPARAHGYRPEWLDALAQETGLQWYGAGDEAVVLGTPELPGLLGLTPSREDHELDYVFPGRRGRYPLSELLEHGVRAPDEVVELLWKWTWRGRVANDTFAALRRGVSARFKAEPAVSATHGPSRSRFRTWKAARPFAGNWYVLPPPEPPSDLIEEEERNRDRARLLLDRFGIVFRELLATELPLLRWKALFRTFRLMELAGEVVGGCFFDGVPGLQFMAPAMLRRLRDGLPEDAVYWIHAQDPVSPCGLGIETLKALLPKRAPGTHVVFHGSRVVLVSQRRGGILEIRTNPDDPNLPRYYAVFEHLLERAVEPMNYISIDRINDVPAVRSPYLPSLRACFHAVTDTKRLTLWKR